MQLNLKIKETVQKNIKIDVDSVKQDYKELKKNDKLILKTQQ